MACARGGATLADSVEPRTSKRRCEKMGICHAERSEASVFSLKTNECRSFATLRMTARVDFFTASNGGPRY